MTDEQRQWAIKRIKEKRAFWTHLVVYVAVNAFLVAIWAITDRSYFWPAWVMLGWGIGLVAHGLTVWFGPSDITEERIQKELRRRRSG
ncbi:MAG: 2TM domain-containing protein [Acidimicrobiia bacterium]